MIKIVFINDWILIIQLLMDSRRSRVAPTVSVEGLRTVTLMVGGFEIVFKQGINFCLNQEHEACARPYNSDQHGCCVYIVGIWCKYI